MTNIENPQALEGVRVLDISGAAGFYCTKLMADMGADVVRVDPPDAAVDRYPGPFYRVHVRGLPVLHFRFPGCDFFVIPELRRVVAWQPVRGFYLVPIAMLRAYIDGYFDIEVEL